MCGSAENGKTALKKFVELKPDLVLLDLGMPDIDGIEVGRQMHAIDASTPMILFTLSDPWGLEGPARKAGFTHVISKSEPWKLLDSIKELVTEIENRFPALRQHLRGDDGQIRRFINFYVNEEDIRFLGNEKYAFQDGDEVLVIPSIAGG